VKTSFGTFDFPTLQAAQQFIANLNVGYARLRRSAQYLLEPEYTQEYVVQTPYGENVFPTQQAAEQFLQNLQLNLGRIQHTAGNLFTTSEEIAQEPPPPIRSADVTAFYATGQNQWLPPETAAPSKTQNPLTNFFSEINSNILNAMRNNPVTKELQNIANELIQNEENVNLVPGLPPLGGSGLIGVGSGQRSKPSQPFPNMDLEANLSAVAAGAISTIDPFVTINAPPPPKAPTMPSILSAESIASYDNAVETYNKRVQEYNRQEIINQRSVFAGGATTAGLLGVSTLGFGGFFEAIGPGGRAAAGFAFGAVPAWAQGENPEQILESGAISAGLFTAGDVLPKVGSVLGDIKFPTFVEEEAVSLSDLRTQLKVDISTRTVFLSPEAQRELEIVRAVNRTPGFPELGLEETPFPKLKLSEPTPFPKGDFPSSDYFLGRSGLGGDLGISSFSSLGKADLPSESESFANIRGEGRGENLMRPLEAEPETETETEITTSQGSQLLLSSSSAEQTATEQAIADMLLGEEEVGPSTKTTELLPYNPSTDPVRQMFIREKEPFIPGYDVQEPYNPQSGGISIEEAKARSQGQGISFKLWGGGVAPISNFVLGPSRRKSVLGKGGPTLGGKVINTQTNLNITLPSVRGSTFPLGSLQQGTNLLPAGALSTDPLTGQQLKQAESTQVSQLQAEQLVRLTRQEELLQEEEEESGREEQLARLEDLEDLGDLRLDFGVPFTLPKSSEKQTKKQVRRFLEVFKFTAFRTGKKQGRIGVGKYEVNAYLKAFYPSTSKKKPQILKSAKGEHEYFRAISLHGKAGIGQFEGNEKMVSFYPTKKGKKTKREEYLPKNDWNIDLFE
jgi:hypothetical protein